MTGKTSERAYAYVGLLTYAKEFANAASTVSEHGQGPGRYVVAAYLYGHSIELALKSILSKHGVTDEGLRKIGHNLSNCLKKVLLLPEQEFVDEALHGIVKGLNPTYGKKHLEYHPGLLVADPLFIMSFRDPVSRFIRKLDRHYRRTLSISNK